MSRQSYGTGMFSPIRNDSAFDSEFNGGRESDPFFDQFKKDTDKRKTENKKNISTRQNLDTRPKSSQDLSSIKSDRNIYSPAKTPKSDCLTKNKLPHVTSRKSSYQSKKAIKENENTLRLGTREHRKSKSSNKDQMLVHVTSRSTRNSELEESLFRPNISSLAEEEFESCFDLPTQIEFSKRLETGKTFNSTKIIMNSNSISEVPTKDYSQDNQSPEICDEIPNFSDKKSHSSTELSNDNDSETSKEQGIHCGTQTGTDREVVEEIHTSIIDKIVKERLSFEFDNIRQMLYLQNLSLMRYMDKNYVDNVKYSAFCDTAMNLIVGLVEENKKLKDIMTSKTF